MAKQKQQDNELIFALDIGTRSIVGIVGRAVEGRFQVLAVETAEHGKRVMLDGQIDDINQVAALAKTVTKALESRLELHLERVCVAAAGRALRTRNGSFTLELSGEQPIDQGNISQLEAGAVGVAEAALQQEEAEHKQFFLVGYTVAQYRLDHYPMATLLHHNGTLAEVDVVATFLPGEVVESLYAAMHNAGLQVASMTLEPIAAMNAAIPADIRLLNLALVDIGAGTTDIALCKGGSVVGYTMATVAGDEITEAIMQGFLVDFQMAEQMKRDLGEKEEIAYTNILGLDETTPAKEVSGVIAEPMAGLAKAIAKQVEEINGGPPSAVFLAGGGSKLFGLREKVAETLGMAEKRVALAGVNFSRSAFSEEMDLNNPEYATPLGIAVSAGMGLLNDSYMVQLNHRPAKLFRNGVLTLQDILMMNGYVYSDMIGRSGRNLTFTLDGRRMTFRGEPAVPAVLRVNGKDASLNTVVHAGDNIDFVPAKGGASASKTLRQVLGADFKGRVLVNNQEASLNTALRQGDVVLSLEGPGVFPIEPQPEKGKEPVQEVFSEAFQKKGGESKPTAPVKEKQEKPELGEPEKKEWEKKEPEEEPKAKQGDLKIFLNQKELSLAAKEDGSPYYLMDLLQYTGLDFQNLDRPVRLEVNGAEASFQQVLKQGDSVGIFCVDTIAPKKQNEEQMYVEE